MRLMSIMFGAVATMIFGLYVFRIPVTDREKAIALREALVKLEHVNTPGGGTGFFTRFTDTSSIVVTKAHVCGEAAGMNGTVPYRKDPVYFERVATDEINDLCLLYNYKASGYYFQALELGDDPDIYDQITMAGYPLLSQMNPQHGYVVGRVWALGQSMYQTSVNAYPGNSGSPVINRWGRVVGVVAATDSRIYYGLMVPVSRLKILMAAFRAEINDQEQTSDY